MRAETAIMSRLEKAIRLLERIEKEYNDLLFDNEHIEQIASISYEIDIVETEINTLRWVLGDITS